MSDSPVRIAVGDCADAHTVWEDVGSRLRGGRIVPFSDSAQAILEDHGDEFDAVVIQNPLADAQAARCAAEAHKHLLIDSPVAEDLSQAEAVIEACEAAGVCFCVGQTLRYQPDVQAIVSRLFSGKLGEPGLLRVHRWRSARQSPLAGLIFADVDLALSLFGAKPAEIYAVGRRTRDGTPQYVQVHCGFPAGGMAVLDFSATLPGGDGYDSLSLIGSWGAAYADDHHNTHLLYRGGRPAALISGRGHSQLLLQMQDFIAAINGSKRPLVGIGECRAVHQVIEAIAQSLTSGRGFRERGGAYEPA